VVGRTVMDVDVVAQIQMGAFTIGVFILYY
jgi:hypothetical protein